MKLNPQKRVHNKNSGRKIRRRPPYRSPKSIDRVKSEEGEEENNNNNKERKKGRKSLTKTFLRLSRSLFVFFPPPESLRSFSLLNYSSRGK